MSFTRKTLLPIIVMSVTTIFMLIVGEILLRALIFSETLSVPALRQAWRYSDGLFEDDFWKLTHIFKSDEGKTESVSVDRVLGWAPQRTARNPLGIIAPDPYQMANVRNRPILFYGDSFVAGVTPVEDRIPQVLDLILRETPVLNYGVSGYGVDQIFLRYMHTIDQFDDPVVLVGILTRDLDRSILSIRGGVKPYYELVDGQIFLHNSPITSTTLEYIEENPPRIASYLARLLMFQLRPIISESRFLQVMGYDDVHRKKLAINRAILEELHKSAASLDIPILVVLFYSWDDLHQENWREGFLKTTLEDLDLAYFDTKPALLNYITETGAAPYDNDHGHLNQAGNRLVAGKLASLVAARRTPTPAPED